MSTDAAPAVDEYREEIKRYVENNSWKNAYSDWARVYEKQYTKEKKSFSIRKFILSEFIADKIGE